MVNLTDEIKNFVRRQKLGFVATVCPDGSPNLSPKGTTTVWDDNHLVFADIASPNTVRNLRTNPQVEINVVNPFARKGYRFKGKAVVYSKEDQAFNAFMSFYKKSVQDAERRIKSVVLVEVENASALVSPAYDFPVTEEEVIDKWKKYYNSLDRQTQTGHDSGMIATVLQQTFAEFRTLYTEAAFEATTPGAVQIEARMDEGPIWVALDNQTVIGTVWVVAKGNRCLRSKHGGHAANERKGNRTRPTRISREICRNQRFQATISNHYSISIAGHQALDSIAPERVLSSSERR